MSPLVVAKDLTRVYRSKRGRVCRGAGAARGRRRVVFARCRKNLGDRRQIRLRQIDARAPGDVDRAAELRLARARRRRRAQSARGASARGCAAPSNWCSKIPMARSIRARRSAPSWKSRCVINTKLGKAERRRQALVDDGARRSQRRACAALPAHVLRRTAPAHRHRARADAAAQAARRRRAGLRARRFGAGASAQSPDRPADRSSALPISSSRTISPWCASSPTTCWSCIWASPSSSGAKERIFERPLHPYTQALLASTPALRRRPQGAPDGQGRGALAARRAQRLRVRDALPARHRFVPRPNARPCVRSAAGWSLVTTRRTFCRPWLRNGAGWWAVTDSNRRHPACKAGALPTELTAHSPPAV